MGEVTIKIICRTIDVFMKVMKFMDGWDISSLLYDVFGKVVMTTHQNVVETEGGVERLEMYKEWHLNDGTVIAVDYEVKEDGKDSRYVGNGQSNMENADSSNGSGKNG